MALDWHKDISFSGLKKGRSKTKTVYPSKTYMNLVAEELRAPELRKAIPLIILVLVLVAAFVKFGVYDFFDRVNQKQAELSHQQQTLSSLEAQLTNYDKVLAEYESYETSRLSADEDQVSVSDALTLIDRFVAPSARIASVDLQGNTMTLSLADITLSGVGALVSTLDSQPMVANVAVATAATDQTTATDVVVTMTVTLQKVGDA